MPALTDLLQQADEKLTRLQHCRDWDNDSIRRAVNVEYTYDSNRIEGNTLTLRETELSFPRTSRSHAPAWECIPESANG